MATTAEQITRIRAVMGKVEGVEQTEADLARVADGFDRIDLAARRVSQNITRGDTGFDRLMRSYGDAAANTATKVEREFERMTRSFTAGRFEPVGGIEAANKAIDSMTSKLLGVGPAAQAVSAKMKEALPQGTGALDVFGIAKGAIDSDADFSNRKAAIDNFAGLEQRLSPASSAAARFVAELKTVNEALAVEPALAARAGAAVDELARKHLGTGPASQAVAAGAKSLLGSGAQPEVLQSVAESAIAFDARAKETTAKRQASVEAFGDLERGLTPASRAAERFVAQWKTVNEALAAEPALAERAAAALAGIAEEQFTGGGRKKDPQRAQTVAQAAQSALGAEGGEEQVRAAALNAAKGVQELEGSHKAGALAARLYAIQLVQTASSLEAGMPLFTTLVQQGHQVVDIFLATGGKLSDIGGIARGLAGALFSVPGAILAVGAAFTTLAIVGEVAQRGMERIQNSLIGVRDNYKALATEVRQAGRELSASTSLSRDQGTALVNAIYQQPNFQGSADPTQRRTQAVGIGKEFDAVNDVLGRAPGDLKALADAFERPSELIDELARRRLPGFNTELQNQARLWEAGGQRAQATDAILERLHQTESKRTVTLTPLEQAERHLDEAMQKLTGSGEGLFTLIGTRLVNAIAFAVDKLAIFVGWMDRIGKWTGSEQAANVRNNIISPFGGGAGVSTLPGGGSAGGSMAPPAAGAQTAVTPEMTALARRLPGQEVEDINRTAQRLGLRPELADFALGITKVEGGIDPATGAPKTSSKGAIGIGQIMPGTAADYNRQLGTSLDPAKYDQGIELMLRILTDLDKKFGGDFAKMAVAYNAGPGHVGDTTLPRETQAYLSNLGLSPPARAAAPQSVPTATAGASGAGGSTGVAQATSDPEQAARNRQTLQYRRQEAEAQLGQATQVRDRLAPVPDGRRDRSADGGPEYEQAAQRVRDLSADLYRLKSAEQEVIDSESRRVQGLQIMNPAQRTLTMGMNDFDENMRKATGATGDANQRLEVRNLLLKAGEQPVQQANYDAGIQVQSGERLARTYEQSAAALSRQQAEERARETVRNSTLQGTTAEGAAVAALTNRYLQLDEQRRRGELGTTQRQGRQQLEEIGAEQRVIQFDPYTRLREQARSQEVNRLREQQFTDQQIQTDPDLQRRITQAQDIAIAERNKAVGEQLRVNRENQDALDRMSGSYLKSAQAVQELQAREEAIRVVREAAIHGTEAQRAAVEALTKSNQDLAHSQAAAQVNTAARTARIGAETTNYEASIVGVPVTQQSQLLAERQARVQANAAGLGPNDEATQNLVKYAKEQAAANDNLNLMKQSWSEVEQTGSRALDTLQQGLEKVFHTGKIKDFATAALQALQDIGMEGLKLSVLNPLKNWAFGTNTPTINSVGQAGSSSGGVLGGLFKALGYGGSGGGSSSGASAFDAAGSDIGGSAASSAVTGAVESAFDAPGFGMFHSGGVVGEASGGYLPASVWTGAPRFHTGADLADDQDSPTGADEFGQTGWFGDNSTPVGGVGTQATLSADNHDRGPGNALMTAAGAFLSSFASKAFGSAFSGIGSEMASGFNWAGGQLSGAASGSTGYDWFGNVGKGFYGPPSGSGHQFHKGGFVGTHGDLVPNLPTEVWSGSPRFHTGWAGNDNRKSAAARLHLAHDEIPAILQKGEVVLTRAQQGRVGHRRIASVLHEGGLAEAGSQRMLPDQVWHGAPKFHDGGDMTGGALAMPMSMPPFSPSMPLPGRGRTSDRDNRDGRNNITIHAPINVNGVRNVQEFANSQQQIRAMAARAMTRASRSL